MTKVSSFKFSGADSSFTYQMPFSKTEKLADGRLMVEGIATSEDLDHDNEIMDYETAKAAFSNWSGNIREQHDPKKAVGRAIEVIPNDETKQIHLRAFISKGAQDTQDKILDGTLSAFSIGGKASKKTSEVVKTGSGEINATRVHVEKLFETSVVDSGCNPATAISVIKSVGANLVAIDLADASIEIKVSKEEIEATNTLADMLNAGIIKASTIVNLANAAISKDQSDSDDDSDDDSDTAADEDGDSDGSKQGAIDAMREITGDDDEALAILQAAEDALQGETEKSNTQKGDFAGHPFRGNQHTGGGGASSKAVHASMKARSVATNSKSSSAAKSNAHASAAAAHRAAAKAEGKAGHATSKAYHEKMAAFHTQQMSKSSKSINGGDIVKVGARNSEVDKKHIQAMHDHSCSLGAVCGGDAMDAGEGDGDDTDTDKSIKSGFTKSDFTKAVNEAIKKATAPLFAEIEKLKATPVFHDQNIRFRVIEKSQDSTPADDFDLEKMSKTLIAVKADGTLDNQQTAVNMMKFQHKFGAKSVR